MPADLKVFLIPHIKLEIDGSDGTLIINQLLAAKRVDTLTKRAKIITERLSQYKTMFSGEFFADDKITMTSEDKSHRYMFSWTPYPDGMMKGKIGLYFTNLNKPKGTKDNAKTRSAAR